MSKLIKFVNSSYEVPLGKKTILEILSDGKMFWVVWPGDIVQILTPNVLTVCKEIIEESFYKCRPDLRQQ